MCLGRRPESAAPGPASPPPPPHGPGTPREHSGPGSHLAPPSSGWGGDGGGDMTRVPASRVEVLCGQEQLTRDHHIARAALVAQPVKHLPAVRQAWVPSLRQDDSLEEEVASCCSVLAWRIPWTEEPGGYSPRVAESDTVTHTHTHTAKLTGFPGAAEGGAQRPSPILQSQARTPPNNPHTPVRPVSICPQTGGGSHL